MGVLKKVGEALEERFVLDGCVVMRTTLLKQGTRYAQRDVLELVVTENGSYYLHSNVCEGHAYYKCTCDEIRTLLRGCRTRSSSFLREPGERETC